ncbi:hypothetical protein [Kocuria palustris]|uniref:hypothetical protein n=1 Tax=Kocuria palustris TaxID=71999 RepID=UPI0011A0C559|nr:hypothetical protein [Kocuria palustris]
MSASSHGRPRQAPATDPAEFAALCRSSPWRWETVRFTLQWIGPETAPVRCWIRRPEDLRVESLDGSALYTATDLTRSRDDFYVSSRPVSWLVPPRLVSPVYTRFGLVERRPEAAYGDPVFGGGRWQAVLDPVELAGDAPQPLYLAERAPAALSGITSSVDEDGRAVREAVARPLVGYRPVEPGHPLAPAATRVRIDERTGICTRSEVLEGPQRGTGHRLRIEAVDDYLNDDLFTPVSFRLTDVSEHLPWTVGG